MRDGTQSLDSRVRTAVAVGEIRREVLRLRGESPISSTEFDAQIAELRRRAEVSAHWGITASWPILGGVEVLVKRTMRILLRWYINPIVEQQNAFNIAVLASIYELEAQIEAIQRSQNPKTDDGKGENNQ